VISLKWATLAWARPQTVGNPNSERILAQTKLFRLDERIPCSSEPSSPRWDLAQWQRWLSDTFAQARAARLGEIIRIPICSSHAKLRNSYQNPNFTQQVVPNINQTQNHAIQVLKDTLYTKIE